MAKKFAALETPSHSFHTNDSSTSDTCSIFGNWDSHNPTGAHLDSKHCDLFDTCFIYDLTYPFQLGLHCYGGTVLLGKFMTTSFVHFLSQHLVANRCEECVTWEIE